MTPNFSCICVTCARVKHLEHSIHAYLQQDYQGQSELIILNTCPKQRLSTLWPHRINPNRTGEVRVVNLAQRPPSLGDARNRAIDLARGSHIVVWDDDDYFLPHHLSTIAKAFQQQSAMQSCDWVWLDTQFWGWGPSIKEVVKGQCPCFSFTKKAWQDAGGYPMLTVGEDRALISRISERQRGGFHRVEGMPSFIYRWDNGVYHTSGQSDDTPDRPRAADRYWADAMSRMERRLEPVGDIALNPKTDIDWPAVADGFWAEHSKKNRMSKNDVCIVQLGRFGDCVNILPVAQHIARTYGAPHWMISREFASLLEGVSYVIPHVVDLTNDQLGAAVELARKTYGHVLVTQIWGKDWHQEKLCQSYNMESWRAAGFMGQFRNQSWRPVFDNRDRERERAVVEKVRGESGGKPLILANTTHSTSSPIRRGAEIFHNLHKWFGDTHHIVDMGTMKLARIYDALGLMEEAQLLVSIDTALIHLAAACDVPTVALVNPEPWLGTIPRINGTARITYREALEEPAKLERALRRAIASKRLSDTFANGNSQFPAIIETKAPTRNLFHCFEVHKEPNPVEQNRKGIAQQSWRALYEKGVTPVPYRDYARSAHIIGEPRKLPFLKDCLWEALRVSEPDDIIFFTNDDCWLHPSLADELRYHVSVYDCCCSQRCEFKGKPFPPATLPPSAFAEAGERHMGRDLFAFTHRWLREMWTEIPDYILGCSEFDLGLAAMIRLYFGIKSDRVNMEECIFPAELPRGYVSHQWHPPHWNTAGYVNSSPGQIHNRRLFKEWATYYLPDLKFHKHNII